MNLDMSFFILPAVIALLIKLGVLFVSRNGIGQSSVFFTMVLLFAAHNLAEVLAFLEYFNGERLTQILRWYYVMSVFAIAAILIYAKELSKIHQQFKYINGVIVGLAVGVSVLIMTTDMVIAGSTSMGYIMTAVKGNQYWIFQVSAVATFVATLWYLVTGYRRATDHLTEIQCSYTLLALAPLLISGLSLIVLMGLGFEVNGALILPIATTLFLLITLRSESKHELTDIRRHIPLSLERQKARKIMGIFSKYAKDEINYRDSMIEIEKLLVTYKHAKNDGNVSTTAATMDIPRSSLYSIFRRLEINSKEDS